MDVIFDSGSELCRDFRDWCGQQPAFVELRFIAADSPRAADLLPASAAAGQSEELTVVADEGTTHSGDSAWLMCLFALREYRSWAGRLAHPSLAPLVRQAIRRFIDSPQLISAWASLPDPQLVTLLREPRRPASSSCVDEWALWA